MARLGGAPGPRAAPERATDDTVLVIGVHRAELAFGDAVAAGLADRPLTVFRIPHGIRRVFHPLKNPLFGKKALSQILWVAA